ncbi:MAG: hypothetical protein A4E36_01920 [Methanoregulaceae archaeon PtaB.Bin009]|jgi:hypothetical protein|nr:MAG: hypothetical protein A4E36_01920 [Methanoregulaceae archaeon PtaB.Bin009]
MLYPGIYRVPGTSSTDKEVNCMKSYRHLRHVLTTSRAGHGFCREADQRGLIAIYERIERKSSRRD